MDVIYIPQTQTSLYQVITVNDCVNRPTACFPCSSCNDCLGKRTYYEWKRKKYCSQCFGKLYGHKCGFCHELITGSEKINFIYYKNQAWHVECFKCPNCGAFLNQNCFGRNNSVVCVDCGFAIKPGNNF